jgi:hypothetical protein
MDIEMFGQLLPEQANAPDSAATYGFAGPVTGTLPPLLSHQLIPNLGHAIKGPCFWHCFCGAIKRAGEESGTDGPHSGQTGLQRGPSIQRFLICSVYSPW